MIVQLLIAICELITEALRTRREEIARTPQAMFEKMLTDRQAREDRLWKFVDGVVNFLQHPGKGLTLPPLPELFGTHDDAGPDTPKPGKDAS